MSREKVFDVFIALGIITEADKKRAFVIKTRFGSMFWPCTRCFFYPSAGKNDLIKSLALRGLCFGFDSVAGYIEALFKDWAIYGGERVLLSSECRYFGAH